MNDKSVLERAKSWVEDVVGTTYYYEVWDDPLDDTTVQTFATSCPKSDEDPDSWVTVHNVSIIDCQIEIEERYEDSVEVKVKAVLFKSDGNDEGEGEEYEEDATYHLRVWDDDIELEAVD